MCVCVMRESWRTERGAEGDSVRRAVRFVRLLRAPRSAMHTAVRSPRIPLAVVLCARCTRTASSSHCTVASAAVWTARCAAQKTERSGGCGVRRRRCRSVVTAVRITGRHHPTASLCVSASVDSHRCWCGEEVQRSAATAWPPHVESSRRRPHAHNQPSPACALGARSNAMHCTALQSRDGHSDGGIGEGKKGKESSDSEWLTGG